MVRIDRSTPPHKKEIDRKAEEDKQVDRRPGRKAQRADDKATNRYYLPSKRADNNGASDSRGGRRSAGELETDAKAIVDFVQSKGKEGVRGSEIKAQFPRIVGGIKSFLSKYTGTDLRTEGEKSGERTSVTGVSPSALEHQPVLERLEPARRRSRSPAPS